MPWTTRHQVVANWPKGGRHLDEAVRVVQSVRQPDRDLRIGELLLKDLKRQRREK